MLATSKFHIKRKQKAIRSKINSFKIRNKMQEPLSEISPPKRHN